ncbi:MAG: RluA family pseudouridine synthase [Betaproteobacteria bacterium]|jgi:tRNA pseudouridine32 synthase/23S rRNA pseudouridine746 synthase
MQAAPDPIDRRTLPDGIGLVFGDDTLLVVDKPPGMLSVPGRGAGVADNLVTRVTAVFADALVVHRLDQATSGLMLFARGAAMQRALSLRFEQRRVHKRYEAVVAGTPDGAEGEVDMPLRLDWPQRPRQVTDVFAGKPALTRWRAVGPVPRVDGAATRMALFPVTGRSHQLRVHMAFIGHPILGDDLYAPLPPRAPRLLLHAAELGFEHPLHGGACRFSSPTPF